MLLSGDVDLTDVFSDGLREHTAKMDESNNPERHVAEMSTFVTHMYSERTRQVFMEIAF